MKRKKIVLTAGGTGGHLFPAQALAQQCLKKPYESDILFIAGGLGKSRYFDRHQFSFQDIACSPLIWRKPLKGLKGVYHLAKGFFQSVKLLKAFQPDVVVGFGSYYTLSTLLAARWLKIPIVLHEANSIPGRANQWLASIATCVALHFPSTAKFFKAKSFEVGLPLREGFQLHTTCKEEASRYYGLSTDQYTLLVCGGSQGAQAINHLMKETIPLLRHLSFQVIHLTGEASNAAELASFYATHGIQAVVKPFESEMQRAWRMADGFIGRAGASTIAESIEFEVPGILIPYPYATDQHQEKNADFLVTHVKSAWKIIEKECTAQLLSKKIEALLHQEQIKHFQSLFKIYKERPCQMTLRDLILNLPSKESI